MQNKMFAYSSSSQAPWTDRFRRAWVSRGVLLDMASLQGRRGVQEIHWRNASAPQIQIFRALKLPGSPTGWPLGPSAFSSCQHIPKVLDGLPWFFQLVHIITAASPGCNAGPRLPSFPQQNVRQPAVAGFLPVRSFPCRKPSIILLLQTGWEAFIRCSFPRPWLSYTNPAFKYRNTFPIEEVPSQPFPAPRGSVSTMGLLSG